MTESYDQIRKRECQWCAKGSFPRQGTHEVFDLGGKNRNQIENYQAVPCTAPTRDQIIDRLTSELTAANETVGRLRDEIGAIAMELRNVEANLIHDPHMSQALVGRFTSMLEALSDTPPVPKPDVCNLCKHPKHTERCDEDAPNAQFRCACAGECPHGKDALYCPDCQPTKEKA